MMEIRTLSTRPLVKPVLDPNYTRQTITTTRQPIFRTTSAPAPTTKITRNVRVLDDQGTPIPGAHVYFNQNTGTTTNFNGQASISSTDPNKKVYITFVGFEAQGFRLADLPATVTMKAGETLKEVVITAPSGRKTDSKVPKYLFPAIGGIALLAILMSMAGGKGSTPKKVTL